MGIASRTSLGGHGRATASGNDHLSEDELFELLSNQRRRHVLHALMRERKPLEVGTLSQEIAAWEDDLDLEEVSSKDRKRVYTALQQSHLPKMDKTGVLEYHSDRGVVEPTPALEDVEIYIDVVRGREIPWSDYYLALTGISALVLGGATLGLAPFTLLPSFAWSVFVVVAFAVSALAHRYFSRRNRLGITEEPPELE